MEIKWLKTFIVAAQHENFRRASEHLFLTQPAVTKHVKRLEEALATILFDRTGKNIVLTAAGRAFLPTARDIVQKYEQGLEDLEGWKQGYKRKLAITVAPQIAASFLPSVLRKFMNQYPDIEVLIHIRNSYKVGEEISTGQADVGLTRVRPIQHALRVLLLHEDPVVLVGPCKEEKISEEKALQSYRLLTHNHPAYWDQLLYEVKRYYPTVRTMKVNQIEITKKFIEQGLGISYLPYTMVKEELQDKRLQEIQPNNVPLPSSSTYVVSKIETEGIRVFIAFLQSEWM